jgi:hypothetical protein
MRTNLAALTLALAASALLAACAKTPGTRPVDLRADLVDCGVHSVAQGAHLPAGAAECIVAAVAGGNRAHMSVTRPTTEGDPIQTVYSVEKDGTVIVSTDTTQDRFGNQGVVRQACTGPKAVGGELTFDHCQPD